MRLALFALVNAVISGFFGTYAYLQGKPAGEIAFTIILVLVVVQLAYVVWLVTVSLLKRKEETPGPESAETFVPGSARRLSSAQSVPGNQTR